MPPKNQFNRKRSDRSGGDSGWEGASELKVEVRSVEGIELGAMRLVPTHVAGRCAHPEHSAKRLYHNACMYKNPDINNRYGEEVRMVQGKTAHGRCRERRKQQEMNVSSAERSCNNLLG